MPTPYASEFTNEMSESYLADLLGRSERRTGEDVGRARSEALAGGLGGQAEMGSKVGWARAAGAERESGIVNQFNLDVAGKQREERMIGERQTWQSSEAQKERDFREMLLARQEQFTRGEREAGQGYERVRGQQGMVAGGLFGLAQSGIKGGAMAYGMSKGAGGGGGGRGVRQEPSSDAWNWYGAE